MDKQEYIKRKEKIVMKMLGNSMIRECDRFEVNRVNPIKKAKKKR